MQLAHACIVCRHIKRLLAILRMQHNDYCISFAARKHNLKKTESL